MTSRLTGLTSGEPVTLAYDREQRSQVMVQQSPKYVLVKNPSQAFDGNSVVAVPVADAGGLSARGGKSAGLGRLYFWDPPSSPPRRLTKTRRTPAAAGPPPLTGT